MNLTLLAIIGITVLALIINYLYTDALYHIARGDNQTARELINDAEKGLIRVQNYI